MARLSVLLLLLLPALIARAELPDLPEPVELEPGVNFSTVTLQRDGVPMRLGVYLPKAATTHKVPCIVIAPAGTPLFFGIGLADGDQPEHLPYARQGFTVVAYEIDGAVPRKSTPAQMAAAIKAFHAADAGVANGKAAIDYVLAKIPQVDPKRIYAVGHSSAATLALQVAESDPRVAGCVAFAPVCDVQARIARFGRSVDAADPTAMTDLGKWSPDKHVDQLKCPTMLFTAADDETVPTATVLAFADRAKKTNAAVQVVQVKSGGHYESMISQGIPAAITFLKGLDAAH